MNASSSQLSHRPNTTSTNSSRPAVAEPVLHMRVAAEIIRLLLAPRGDDVPADAAFGDVVERGELARDVVGLVVGGRRAGDEAEALRHRGERADHGQRLEHVDARVVGELRVVLRRMAHRDAVGPEHEVEAGAFRLPRHLLPEADVHRRIHPRSRHPPARGVGAVRDDVEPELHLAVLDRHSGVPVRGRCATRPRVGTGRQARQSTYPIDFIP